MGKEVDPREPGGCAIMIITIFLALIILGLISYYSQHPHSLH